MIFKNISIIDENFEILDGMDVAIEGNSITQISKNSEISLESGETEVYDGKNKLLMPGYVNTHSHAPMTLMRGLGEDLPLKDWLDQKILPFEEKLTGIDCYNGTLLAIAEMLSSGTTCFCEMYFFCEDIAKAVIKSGIKANIARSIVSFDDTPLQDSFRFRESESLYRTYNNSNNGKILVDFSVHDEYTMREKSLREFFEYTSANGIPVMSHISETLYQHDACKSRNRGMTPVEFFKECGGFKTRTILAHGVHLADSDMEILSENGVGVSHCPQSNLKLGSGIARVSKMIECGINVALGTDGAASNNDLDMHSEMLTYALLQKGITGDPTCVSKKDALRAATLNGAIACGRFDSGLVKVGNKADLVVYDLHKPHYYPKSHDMLSNLVYSGKSSDVVLTMVDGNILYKNGEFMTIDLEKLLFDITK